MGSPPRFSPTESTSSHWIDAELCAHGISPFFTHRLYVILLDWCRIMCPWDLLVCHAQEVGDLVGLMQNSVLMGSPRFSPTGSTWSRWINAGFCAHEISPSFTHSGYVISLDRCRIVCLWNLPISYPQLVGDLMGFPIFHPQEIGDLIG